MNRLSGRRSGWLAGATLALLVAALAVPAHAQWKWRDKNGQVHLSDLPPPREVAEKDVLQRPNATVRAPAQTAAPAASAVLAEAPRVDAELEARRRKAEQEQTAQRKAEAEKLASARAENCQRAQAQLRSLESGMRLVRVNDKGEREVLDDQQRAGESQRARNIIAADCG